MSLGYFCAAAMRLSTDICAIVAFLNSSTTFANSNGAKLWYKRRKKKKERACRPRRRSIGLQGKDLRAVANRMRPLRYLLFPTCRLGDHVEKYFGNPVPFGVRSQLDP